MNIKVRPAKKIRGEVRLSGDKSISHRAVIISSLARGKSSIRNFLNCEDCLHTLSAFRQLGVGIKEEKEELIIEGRGLAGLTPPTVPLDLGNSATSLRLITGVLAGQKFSATLTGDASLRRRPMKRVTRPLRKMGAGISGRDDANFAPLTIAGAELETICYSSPVASAQVKSAILLAGLYAKGKTEVREPSSSRDHTERMLQLFGAEIEFDKSASSLSENVVTIRGGKELTPPREALALPGDFSSAAFLLAAAVILPGSSIIIKDVGLNPGRIGYLETLKAMGAKITVSGFREVSGEPRADVAAETSSLVSCRVEKTMVPRMIDELPILAVLAAHARGRTVIEGAGELRVKETDRIDSMTSGLSRMGARISSRGDNLIIEGGGILTGAEVETFGDHRTAMSLVIAGLTGRGETLVKDTACIRTSFPDFEKILAQLVIR